MINVKWNKSYNISKFPNVRCKMSDVWCNFNIIYDFLICGEDVGGKKWLEICDEVLDRNYIDVTSGV